MNLPAGIIVLVCAALVGCAAEVAALEPSTRNAGNPNAPESPLPQMQALSSIGMSESEPSDTQPFPETRHDMHDMAGMNHETPATESTPTVVSASQPTELLYTCKMHPQVLLKKPGNCPICGMKLVPKSKSSETGQSGRGGQP